MVLVNINRAELRDIHVEGFKKPLLEIQNVTGSGLDAAVPRKDQTKGSADKKN